MNLQAEYFNQRAADWEQMIEDETRQCLARIVNELEIQPGARVLDVGCGTGVLLPLLLEAVGESGRVVALDIADKMLEEAGRLHQDPRLEFVHADAACSGLPRESFDEIVCNSCFPHFQDKPLVLASLCRLLKSGGRLVICHTQNRAEINSMHRGIGGMVAGDRLPEDQVMREWLKQAGFESICIRDNERYLVCCRRPLEAYAQSSSRLTDLSTRLQEILLLYEAFAAGIFEVLGSRQLSAGDLAAEQGLEESRLTLLLDALVSIDLLEKEGLRYLNSPLARRHLCSDSSDYMGDILQLQLAPERRQNWDKVGPWLKGETVMPNPFTEPAAVFNPSFIRAMAQSAQVQKDFQQSMDIVSAHPVFKNSQRLLDLGGGHGLYSIALQQKRTGLQACVFDLPHLEPITADFARQHSTNLNFHGGNFHHDEIPGGQDIILAFDMLYPARDQVGKVLKKVYAALNPGGYLFTRHWMLNPERTWPSRAAMFALHTRFSNPDAHVPTEEEMRQLISEAGFEVEAAYCLEESRATMMVARRQ